MRRTNRNRIEFHGDVVLRFPVTARDQAALAEHAHKQQSAHAAGLSAPAVLSVHPEGPAPHMAMERVGGIALIETELDADAQRRLAQELAGFLDRMWAVRDWPPAEVEWARVWDVLAHVAPGALTEAAAGVAATAPIRVTHGDLSGGNLMVDASGHLLAVLDWDEARMSDPAMDFSALCANVPAPIAAHLRELVPGAREMDERARIYLDTWGLQNDLWQADRHPWILGETPVVEPRM